MPPFRVAYYLNGPIFVKIFLRKVLLRTWCNLFLLQTFFSLQFWIRWLGRASATTTDGSNNRRLSECANMIFVSFVFFLYLFTSISLYFSLYLYLFIYHYLYLYISFLLSIYIFKSHYFYLSISHYLYLSISISLYISISFCLSLLFLYFSMSLSICLHLSLFFSHFLFV